MLYELIGICRPYKLHEVREIVTTAGQQILRNGGVIRGIANWGTFDLTKPIKHNTVRASKGHYFAMRFDASAPTQEMVRSTMALDPRMLRVTSVRLGDGKLHNLSKFGGPDWKHVYGEVADAGVRDEGEQEGEQQREVKVDWPRLEM